MLEKAAVAKLIEIIEEIGLTPESVDAYEDCEIIADLMDESTIAKVNDAHLRSTLMEMRRLHADIRLMNQPAYIDKAAELFGKIPKCKHVLKYHEAEQLCKSLGEQDLMGISDPVLRATLRSLSHVHDVISEKKANVLRQVRLK